MARKITKKMSRKVYLRRIRNGLLVKLLLLLMLMVAGLRLLDLRAQIHDAKREQTALAARVQQKKQINASLRADLSKAEDEEYLQELAREHLGVVFPGEKIFRDLG